VLLEHLAQFFLGGGEREIPDIEFLQRSLPRRMPFERLESVRLCANPRTDGPPELHPRNILPGHVDGGKIETPQAHRGLLATSDAPNGSA
jgi:hypothetical protein